MHYFFTVHRLSTVEDDPNGMDLPNVAAALSQAERAMAELKREGGYKDPALVMIVHHHTVLSLHFLPGCA